jgi:fatty acid desaturase
MSAALETNYQVFTEMMVSDRRETWLTAVIVMAVVTAGALAYALVRRRLPLVVFEVAAVVVVVLLAVYFHHAIPVPPGSQSPGIGP